MKGVYYCLLISFLLGGEVFGQRTLHGFVLSQEGGKPLAGVEISIRNGDRAVSETDGSYSLNLGDGSFQDAGMEMVVYLSHPKLGFNKATIIIPKDLSRGTDLLFSMNKYMGIAGIVKDNDTGELLPGISVTVKMTGLDGNEIPISAVLTDSFGSFYFKIDRHEVGDVKTVQFLVQDKLHNCFETATPLIYISQNIEIRLVRKPGCLEAVKKPSENESSGASLTFGSICFQNKLNTTIHVAIGYGPEDGWLLQSSIQSFKIGPLQEKCFEGLVPRVYSVCAGSNSTNWWPDDLIDRRSVVEAGKVSKIVVE